MNILQTERQWKVKDSVITLGKSIIVMEHFDTCPRLISEILMKTTQLISNLQWDSMLRKYGWWSEALCPCFSQYLWYDSVKSLSISASLFPYEVKYILVKFNGAYWQKSPSFVLNNAYCSALLWCFTSIRRRTGKPSWHEMCVWM